MENDQYKKEGGHLYELCTDEFGRQTWVHCYQNARYSADTKRNFQFLIDEYSDYIEYHINW